VAWWTVQKAVNAAALVLVDPDTHAVRRPRGACAGAG